MSNVFVPLQFGNTCYCNSVLQALYYCKPFRDMVLLYKHQTKNQKKETLLTCLADLFYSVAIQKRKTGSIAPKKFIQRLRKENCKFRYMFWINFASNSYGISVLEQRVCYSGINITWDIVVFLFGNIVCTMIDTCSIGWNRYCIE